MHRWWWNKKTDVTDTLRPDGSMVEVVQRQVELVLGFGEVKPQVSSKNTVGTHLDLLRLARFYKNSIDQEQVEEMIAFQAVEAEGLYTMFDIGDIDVPAYLKDLK
ncbi:hypothetical protein DFQ28_000796, partial [Apophysomyces sp. BC1034]